MSEEKLDLNGFEQYCKSINFIKSIGSYKIYLNKGYEVLKQISNDNLESFIEKIEDNNQYLKEEFEEQIKTRNLHQDLYSDFKSAGKKYFEFLKSRNITYWLIPSNQNHYDAIGAFKKYKIIDWGNGQNNAIKEGDIIYLYSSKPIGAIIIKAKVIKSGLKKDELLNHDESEFEKRTDPMIPDSYFRLKLLKFTNRRTLSSINLEKNGLKGNIQGKRTISGELLAYIIKNENGEESMKTQPLNQILYGPPGTGKTYNTINKALEIIDGEAPSDRSEAKAKFEEYKKAGQIEFVTFHQSYGYEEFVEGIKAKTTDQGIEYKIEAAIFKKLTKLAKENFENSKKTTIELKQEKSLKQKLEIFLNDALENGTEFFKTKGGKFKIIELSQDEITVFAEDSNYSDKKLSMPIDEFYKILEINFEIKTSRQMAKDVFNINNQRQRDTYYFALSKKFHETKIEDIVEVDNEEPLKNFILIIDEINRGNISKIFGELITLIEPSKRIGADEEIRIKLPYSNDDFGVPQNLYIIGTMNTADRSIALMDTALRRRFDFREMMPDLETLNGLVVDGIDIKSMLEKINKRIEYLYDRDHTIGHAYFMSLKDEKVADKKAELDSIFRNKIIPLLQEYFYDDWEKILMVLGKDGFIEKEEVVPNIFSYKNDDYLEEKSSVYTIKKEFDFSEFTNDN